MSTRRYELNAPSVIGEAVDGEVMVMNLRDGIYYSVAGDGATVWPALIGGVPIDDIAAAAASGAQVPIERVRADLEAFVARLCDEGVLRPAESGAASPGAPPRFAGAGDYRGFAFERFDDMRAMLILDPVHEVGEFGWPQQQGGAKPSS
jgi:hypothetical protein